MRVDHVKYGRAEMTLRVARYDNLGDLKRFMDKAEYAREHIPNRYDDWAGGSRQSFNEGCQKGDAGYARRAEKLVEHFGNVALQDYEMTLENNMMNGVLDYQAAMSGDPMCMYGPTIEETDRAPVAIYVDSWTSSTIKRQTMERRGIALLALVQALSIFRPVHLTILAACHHRPSGTDTLQIIPVPTAPMDVSRASWMLGCPAFFRVGLVNLVHEIAQDSRFCGIPGLRDNDWQQHKMGNWLAEREGINDVIFLPRMYGHDERWADEGSVLKWVQGQMKKYVNPN